MSKKIGYKPAPANKNIGGKTHGSFKNDGQKQGRKAPAAKEKPADMTAEKFMKKTIEDFRKQGKRRIQMMPDGGAFH